jgi:hypothetical protein
VGLSGVAWGLSFSWVGGFVDFPFSMDVQYFLDVPFLELAFLRRQSRV